MKYSKSTPRLLIDTDGAVDDAVALYVFMVAHYLGLCKIEAITVTAGSTDVDSATRNVLRVLEAAGRTDIPVYKGCNTSLISTERFLDFFGRDGFLDLDWLTQPNESRIRKLHGAIALGKIITDNPGKISLIAIGAVTNIAVARQLYPNLMKDVKEVFIVGGNYRAVGSVVPSAEFNFYMDPEAAFITLRDVDKPITIFPREVSLDIKIEPEWRYDVLGAVDNKVLKLIERAEKLVYGPKSPVWNPSDAIGAVAYLYSYTMIKKELFLPSTVELHGWHTRGQTVVDHLNSTIPNTRFITKIDQKFFKNFMLYSAEQTKDGFVAKRSFLKG